MKSPFPGMDPYIEGQSLWSDFHHNLIVDLKHEIQRQLPKGYVARLSHRKYWDIATLEIESAMEAAVQVRHSRQRPTTTSGRPPTTAPAAIADPPTSRMQGLMEFEEREIFLDIYKYDPDQQLVTSVELLSPANKRRGSVGWDQYERKRNIFMNGHANLVEIDLLRGGRRHAMAARWPASPYAIAVFRRQHAPACDVWAGFTTRPLPRIAVPLDPPDADGVVALQPIVDTIYELSRYAVQIRYDRPIEPPLSLEEAKIAAARAGLSK